MLGGDFNLKHFTGAVKSVIALSLQSPELQLKGSIHQQEMQISLKNIFNTNKEETFIFHVFNLNFI